MERKGSAAPALLDQLIATYRDAATRMQALPHFNAALDVEAVGFREHGGRHVGVVITPWFMNLTVLPSAEEQAAWRVGSTTRLEFPSGPYDLVVSDAGTAGPIATTSLFALMQDFADPTAARATATAALAALFEPLAPPPSPGLPMAARVFSRRKLFGG